MLELQRVGLDLGLGGDELCLALLQPAIGSNDVLEGCDEKIEDLLLFRIDDEFFAEKDDLDTDREFPVSSCTSISEDGTNPINELLGFVRLGDKVVGTALEPADDVHR